MVDACIFHRSHPFLFKIGGQPEPTFLKRFPACLLRQLLLGTPKLGCAGVRMGSGRPNPTSDDEPGHFRPIPASRRDLPNFPNAPRGCPVHFRHCHRYSRSHHHAYRFFTVPSFHGTKTRFCIDSKVIRVANQAGISPNCLRVPGGASRCPDVDIWVEKTRSGAPRNPKTAILTPGKSIFHQSTRN